MRQAADGFAPHQHFPPIRRRGEVSEGGIEPLSLALLDSSPGRGAKRGFANHKSCRDGRQDTVPGHSGAGNKAHPQRRDGQGSGPGKVLLQISTQGGRQAAPHGTEPHQYHRPARKRLLYRKAGVAEGPDIQRCVCHGEPGGEYLPGLIA